MASHARKFSGSLRSLAKVLLISKLADIMGQIDTYTAPLFYILDPHLSAHHDIVFYYFTMGLPFCL